MGTPVAFAKAASEMQSMIIAKAAIASNVLNAKMQGSRFMMFISALVIKRGIRNEY